MTGPICTEAKESHRLKVILKSKLPTDTFCYPSTEQEYNAALAPVEPPRDPLGELATHRLIMQRFSSVVELNREITHLAGSLPEPLRTTIVTGINNINDACANAFSEIERCNAEKK
jgi:hypothetical protein